MPLNTLTSYHKAAQDFERARRAAALRGLLARLRGSSEELLPYEEVRRQLRASSSSPRGLQDIPLDAIVGSVGRYTDFTRAFLPKHESDRDRWSRVMMAVSSLKGVPPIDVFQIGEVYFVLDGNHRVSVARQLGATSIEAHVIEVHSRVPLTPDTDVDDLILKAEYASFLELTGLDQQRPEADLTVTAPGRYSVLEEHISVHRYLMGIDQGREISYPEAVVHWYDEVYRPVVEVIGRQGLLEDFPGRTETDLYLWILCHQAELGESLGWQLEPAEAAAQLAQGFSSRPGRVLARVGGRLLEAVTPDSLEGGGRPGRWRHEREALQERGGLFSRLLVPISGDEAGWQALEQAIEVAQREGGRVRGLHVVPEPEELDTAQAVQGRFDDRCRQAGVTGNLALEVGEVTQALCDRSHWADLVVIKLDHPPPPQLLARLDSGIRSLIGRCGRPVMTVPHLARPLEGLLLAYGGSAKAREALYVAAYLAGCWGVPLTVLTVEEGGTDVATVQAGAKAYLDERQVQATWIVAGGPVAEAVLQTADEHDPSLLIMGGYGRRPLMDAVLGSAVDQVLRESDRPVLICP